MDEHGSVSGLVTAEDLVEELVGEILSEQEPEPIRREPDGTILVQGTVPIRELNRELGLELPENDGWTSIAGLLIAKAGLIPKRGKKIVLDRGIALEVVESTRQQVRLVRLHISALPTEI
jgi:putative hemolysin